MNFIRLKVILALLLTCLFALVQRPDHTRVIAARTG